MKIYAVRHGQTDWNVEHRMQGQTDTPLNDTGRAQAAALVGDVAKLGISKMYTSDLGRARETARIIADGNFEIIADKRLREVSYGDLEGRNREEIGDKEWQWYRQDPRHYNGEPPESVFARVKSFLSGLDKNGGDVLVVSHGGTIRMMLYCQTRAEFDLKSFDEFITAGIKVENATITVLA